MTSSRKPARNSRYTPPNISAPILNLGTVRYLVPRWERSPLGAQISTWRGNYPTNIDIAGVLVLFFEECWGLVDEIPHLVDTNIQTLIANEGQLIGVYKTADGLIRVDYSTKTRVIVMTSGFRNMGQVVRFRAMRVSKPATIKLDVSGTHAMSEIKGAKALLSALQVFKLSVSGYEHLQIEEYQTALVRTRLNMDRTDSFRQAVEKAIVDSQRLQKTIVSP